MLFDDCIQNVTFECVLHWQHKLGKITNCTGGGGGSIIVFIFTCNADFHRQSTLNYYGS